MRNKGKIISWNDEKGFGFILPKSGGKQVFVHISSFSKRNKRPIINQLISYELSTDKNGRACAINAVLAGSKLQSKSPVDIYAALTTLSAVFFLFFVAFSVITTKIPPVIFLLYFIASILSFILYAVDKSAAKKGAWRIQESTLHLVSLIGGWPGALIAQQELRHKSKKQSFRSVFWITVIINSSVLYWVFTPVGSATLYSYINKIT
jgi:uncharacterized membrane protein YsdA (DUF1294 family)/cold shock CspA family protein